MKITIYELARKAGVSISTASKALNDRKDVGDATKKRVREIARQLNYEPSQFARALALRKTENIGVITVRYYSTPMLTNPFYSKIIEGVEEALIGSNLNLVTNVLRKDQVEQLEMPKMLREKSVDGIILLGHMPYNVVEMIAERGLPVVMVDNYYKNAEISSVTTDSVEGAHKVVDYLIKTGHKNIAYLGGPSKRHGFRQRAEGYKKALADNNIPLDERYVIFNDEEDEKDYTWMKKIFGYEKKPDAIFACNDVHAILAINMLREMGMSVPGDISVAGYDNIDVGEHFIPSLTTVDVKKEDMGKKAVELLLAAGTENPPPPQHIVFPTELIIRDSVRKRN